jgi:cytochrome c peroxidase
MKSARITPLASTLAMAVSLSATMTGAMADSPVIIPDTTQHELKAKGGETYRIFLSIPKSPPPREGYPVFYLTDGNTSFPVFMAVANLRPPGSSPFVVVGIGYPSDNAADHRIRRTFDLTPEVSAEWLKTAEPRLAGARTGGEGEFRSFIDEVVKPFVRSRARIDPDRQTLWGHSFGGLFVLNTMLKNPESFRNYLISSPSLWWNDHETLKTADSVTRLWSESDRKRDVRVFLSIGEFDEKPRPGDSTERTEVLERRRMVRNAKKLAELIDRLKHRGIRSKFREFENEDHGSVVLRASVAGSIFALEDSPSNRPSRAPVSSGKSLTQRQLKLPSTPYSYGRDVLPAHFLTETAKSYDSTPASNPISDWGATLGRALFYDTRLSASGTVACASCHHQKNAFADPRKFSAGHRGGLTDRNAMSLVNLRYSRVGLFWDLRAATLEDQVLQPIRSPLEMGRTMEDSISIIRADKRYVELFEKSFGDSEVTEARISKALAQFVRSIVSYRSKFDEGLARSASVDADFPNYSKAENRGKSIFFEKCSICHTDGRGAQSAYFSMFAALNNGIDRTGEEPDAGRADISLVPNDVGLFKASDLRNVEYTSPYMHDGRFVTLEEVVDHYSDRVNQHPNVSPFIFNMRFSSDDKAAIVAFLKTLSDRSLLEDPRFSDPWAGSIAKQENPLPSADQETTPHGNKDKMQLVDIVECLKSEKGLIPGQVRIWLDSLDISKDGMIEAKEAGPLNQLLLERGTPPRFDRRRFSPSTLRTATAGEAPPALMSVDRNRDERITPDELPDSRRYLVELGDFDLDGALNLDEARTVEAVERYVSLRANLRDRTRIERIISKSIENDSDRNSKIADLHHAKEVHDRSIDESDANTIERLKVTLGTGEFAKFQHLMLRAQESRELARIAAGVHIDTIAAQVFEFDKDKDGTLDAHELDSLAIILDETPGGFGSRRVELPNAKTFAVRLMARDADRNGGITADEIPERNREATMKADRDGNGIIDQAEAEDFYRESCFLQLIREGVYSGGGFVNAFTNAERLVADLQISDEQKSQAKAILKSHERSITDEIAGTVKTVFQTIPRGRSKSVAIP